MRYALLALVALTLLAAIPMANAAPRTPAGDDTTCLPQPGTYILPTGVQARGGTEWLFSGAPNGAGSYDGEWTPLNCVQTVPMP
jgi:hypothetical protein